MDATIIAAIVAGVLALLGILLKKYLDGNSTYDIRLTGTSSLHIDIDQPLTTITKGVDLDMSGLGNSSRYKALSDVVVPFYPASPDDVNRLNSTFNPNNLSAIQPSNLTLKPSQQSRSRALQVGPIETKTSFEEALTPQTSDIRFSLGLDKALTFQNSDLLFDESTIVYANKRDSIGLIAKFDGTNVKKIEIIDNEKGFTFRIEKK